MSEWPDLAGRLDTAKGAHVLAVRVYYEDTDFSGVAYHGAYVRFLERGRSDFLRLLGIDQGQMHGAEALAFAVRSMSIDFLSPARVDDVLEIETRVGDLGGASVTLVQSIRHQKRLLVTASVRIALVGQGRAQRFPPALRASFLSQIRDQAGVEATS
jgi:acyl-CoA thioester hydrolase